MAREGRGRQENLQNLCQTVSLEFVGVKNQRNTVSNKDPHLRLASDLHTHSMAPALTHEHAHTKIIIHNIWRLRNRGLLVLYNLPANFPAHLDVTFMEQEI